MFLIPQQMSENADNGVFLSCIHQKIDPELINLAGTCVTSDARVAFVSHK